MSIQTLGCVDVLVNWEKDVMIREHLARAFSFLPKRQHFLLWQISFYRRAGVVVRRILMKLDDGREDFKEADSCERMFFVIFYLFCLVALNLTLSACGQTAGRTHAQELDMLWQKKRAATKENAAAWAHLWDGRTWMAAVQESTIQRQNLDADMLAQFKKTGINRQIEGAIKNKLVGTFSDQFAHLLKVDELSSFQQALYNETVIEFSYVSSEKITAERVVTGDEKQEWFLFIELPHNPVLWSKVLGFPFDFLDNSPKSLLELARTQFATLELMGDFAWVEPSLMNETLQSATPKPGEATPKPGPRPPEWEVYSDGTPIPPNANRVRQILTRMNWHLAQDFLQTRASTKLDIPVAVFDSGIDYEHPELKGRMFKNPAEQANGQDDDGNGYVDDIYGFDATFRPRELDKSYRPPGAADVGGPGAPCPQELYQGGEEAGGSCGHGTHVAGIIAANLGGEITFGICDACSLYSVRISQACLFPDSQRKRACVPPPSSQPGAGKWVANRSIEDTSVVRGLNYLLNFKDPKTGKLNIFIVNMSFGKYFYNRSMASALAKLEANGVLIVTAAGNDDTDTPMFPAGYDTSLSVCATSEDEGTAEYGKRGAYAKADFSNFGDWVDICAPGVDIFSTFPGNETKMQNGTSMAAPVVAGAAGYLWSVLASLGETNSTIRYRLERYANPTLLYDVAANPKNRFYGDRIGRENSYQLGWGFIDIEAALKAELGQAPKSFVKVDNASGYNSQVEAGCMISSIGKRTFSLMRLTSSMPFVLILFLLFLRIRRRQTRWH